MEKYISYIHFENETLTLIINCPKDMLYILKLIFEEKLKIIFDNNSKKQLFDYEEAEYKNELLQLLNKQISEISEFVATHPNLNSSYIYPGLLSKKVIIQNIDMKTFKKFEYYCQIYENNIYLTELYKHVFEYCDDLKAFRKLYRNTEITELPNIKNFVKIVNKTCNQVCCTKCGITWDGNSQCNCYNDHNSKYEYIGYCDKCNKYTNNYC